MTTTISIAVLLRATLLVGGFLLSSIAANAQGNSCENSPKEKSKIIGTIGFNPYAASTPEQRLAPDQVVQNSGGFYSTADKRSAWIARAQLADVPANRREILWRMERKTVGGDSRNRSAFVFRFTNGKYEGISDSI
jgi:hypothetical protein